MEKNIKKDLIIMFGALVIFIIAAIFCFVVINKNKGKNESNNNDNINKILENVVVLDEESETVDITDVEYKDIALYKEDGTKVELSSFKDKPVMILFWNKDNQDSVKVLEKVEEMHKKYEEKITFLMVDTAKEIDKEIKNAISMEIYYDFSGEAAKNYNVDTVPSMIYIDKNNEILNAKKGFTTSDALEANLDLLADNI